MIPGCRGPSAAPAPPPDRSGKEEEDEGFRRGMREQEDEGFKRGMRLEWFSGQKDGRVLNADDVSVIED